MAAVIKPRKPTYEEKNKIYNACIVHDLHTIQDLASNGVDVTGIVDDENNKTVLHVAAETDQIKTINFLLSQGAEVNDVDLWHTTPLHYAIYNGNIDCVAILLNSGANFNIKNEYDKTPLQLAVESNQSETVFHIVHHFNIDITKHSSYMQRKIKRLMKEAQKKKGKQVERLIKEAQIRQGSPSKGAVLNVSLIDDHNSDVSSVLLEQPYGAKMVEFILDEDKYFMSFQHSYYLLYQSFKPSTSNIILQRYPVPETFKSFIQKQCHWRIINQSMLNYMLIELRKDNNFTKFWETLIMMIDEPPLKKMMEKYASLKRNVNIVFGETSSSSCHEENFVCRSTAETSEQTVDHQPRPAAPTSPLQPQPPFYDQPRPTELTTSPAEYSSIAVEIQSSQAEPQPSLLSPQWLSAESSPLPIVQSDLSTVAKNETVNARKVFNEYNPKLVRLLPLKDPYFVASLTQQNLFSGVLKEKVMRASTRADASACFLYETIECSLDVDDVEPFNKLLIVMENFENLTLIKLAREIKQKMTQNNRTEEEPYGAKDVDLMLSSEKYYMPFQHSYHLLYQSFKPTALHIILQRYAVPITLKDSIQRQSNWRTVNQSLLNYLLIELRTDNDHGKFWDTLTMMIEEPSLKKMVKNYASMKRNMISSISHEEKLTYLNKAETSEQIVDHQPPPAAQSPQVLPYDQPQPTELTTSPAEYSSIADEIQSSQAEPQSSLLSPHWLSAESSPSPRVEIAKNEAMNAKKAYKQFNPKLVRLLPLKNPYFLADLTQQNLFSGALKEEVMAASVRADASTCFLLKAIEPSLDVNDTEPFHKLLIVMESYDDPTINKLAKDIKDRITDSNKAEIRSTASNITEDQKQSLSQSSTTEENKGTFNNRSQEKATLMTDRQLPPEISVEQEETMATSMQIVEHEQPISEPSISLEPQPSQVVVEPLIRVESDSLSATEDVQEITEHKPKNKVGIQKTCKRRCIIL